MASLVGGEAAFLNDNERMRLAAHRVAEAVTPLLIELNTKYPKFDLTGAVELVAKVAPTFDELLVGQVQ